ncbi:hypothetical protein [Cystobacter ferrugineus]|nr:hypothetical protein [Cystobacter ferrugineus]
MSIVRASPEAAEALYREASTRALEILEESWSGLIEALGEQEKTGEATLISERAGQIFPGSKQLTEARTFAKVGLRSS